MILFRFVELNKLTMEIANPNFMYYTDIVRYNTVINYGHNGNIYNRGVNFH